jgi:hypothetical protein
MMKAQSAQSDRGDAWQPGLAGKWPLVLRLGEGDSSCGFPDRRFGRAALIGSDYPRITPAPIAQPEAINLMDSPKLNRVRHLVAVDSLLSRFPRLKLAVPAEPGAFNAVFWRHPIALPVAR